MTCPAPNHRQTKLATVAGENSKTFSILQTKILPSGVRRDQKQSYENTWVVFLSNTLKDNTLCSKSVIAGLMIKITVTDSSLGACISGLPANCQWGTFGEWRSLPHSLSVFPISICLSLLSRWGHFGNERRELFKIQNRVYHSCSPCPGRSLSLCYTASLEKDNLCVWHVWLKEKVIERDKQRQTRDLAFGLCTVYSSGGCTFLKTDHMTGWMGGRTRVGATIVGLNYLVDQMVGVELSRVKNYVCVAFPSSEKRPCSHKQSGPNLRSNWTKFNSKLNH